MASSIVHLAIANELIKALTFDAPFRLKLGAVLADFGRMPESHLKISVRNGQKRTYDLDGFRTRFGEKLLVDDLYLGFYLHLVQDAVYRRFVYDKYAWDPAPAGNIERLHRDYGIVNGYVIEKYSLKNDVTVPEAFESEAINTLCAFDTARLLEAMAAFFEPADEGEIFFFTKEMTDEFIEEAVEVCVKEIDALRSGGAGMDMLEWAWRVAAKRL